MKRFSQLTQTASEADLVAGNFLAIDVPGVGGATKKMPGNCVAPKSIQDNITQSIAPVFDPDHGGPNGDGNYPAGYSVMYQGKRYIFKADHSGSWSGTDVEFSPISPKIDQIKNENDSNYVFALVDEYGKILFSVDSGGNINFKKGIPEALSSQIKKTEYFDTQNDAEIAFALVNDSGEIVAYIDKDGIVQGKLAESNSIKKLVKNLEKMISGSFKPETFCETGDGSFSSPYESIDGSAGLFNALSSLNRGGRVELSAFDYKLTTAVKLTQFSTRLCGGAMGYQSDPLAIHHSKTGSVITLGNANSRIIAGGGKGQEISRVGFYGVEPNDYKTTITGLFNPSAPLNNCGIEISSFFDQGKMEKLCFALLGAGVVIVDGHLDASIFDNLNFDGCNTGFWLPANGAGNYVIHSYFEKNIFADMCGMAAYIRYMQNGFFCKNHVSGIGAFISQDMETAVGYKCCAFVGGSGNQICENIFKNPGKVAKRIFGEGDGNYTDADCIALVVSGNRHLVLGNRFLSSAGQSLLVVGNNSNVSYNYVADSGARGISVTGDKNLVQGNYVVGGTNESLVVNGDNNLIIGNYLAGRLILNGDNNKVIGNIYSMVVDNGNGNTIQ